MIKLAQKTFLLSALLGCSISFIGCTAGTTAKTDNKTSNSTTVTETKKTETTETKKTEEPKTVAKSEITEGVTGVPECDDYIKKYEACLNDKMPESMRAAFKSSFEQSRQAWKQAASTPQGRASLAPACQQALEAAKKATASYGCTF